MVDILRWRYEIIVWKKVISDIWPYLGWCDDFVVNKILDLMTVRYSSWCHSHGLG